MSDRTLEERATAIRTEADALSLANATALSISEQRDVKYGKWVKMTISDSMEGVKQNFSDDEPQPFKALEIKGEYEWDNSGDLELLNYEGVQLRFTRKDSGGFHAMLKAGYQVKMKIFTENFRYFEDNIKSEYEDRFSSDSFQQRGAGYDEYIRVWMMRENDYLSIDIDGDIKGIANFRLRLDGDFYNVSNPDNFDNEVEIDIDEVWFWNANYSTITYVAETDDVVVEDGDDVIKDDDVDDTTNDDDEVEGGNEDDTKDDEPDDGDDTDDGGDDDGTKDDDENYSIFLVLGGITIILVGAFVFLRGGRSGE